MQDFRFSSQQCCWRFESSGMWWRVTGRVVTSILKACQSSSYKHSNLMMSGTSKDQSASIFMSQGVLVESVVEDSLTLKMKALWFFKMLGTSCPRQSITSHNTDSSCTARVSQQTNAKSARGKSQYRQTEWQEDFSWKGYKLRSERKQSSLWTPQSKVVVTAGLGKQCKIRDHYSVRFSEMWHCTF
jgi:hypothetical protein